MNKDELGFEHLLKFTRDEHWEILFLRDGSVFFDNIYGQNLALKLPNEFEIRFLRELSLGATIADAVACVESILRRRIREREKSLIHYLREKGVVSTNTNEIEKELHESIATRFGSQITWLNAQSGGHGVSAFKKLQESTVAIVGVGGAGSLYAFMMAAAGIGKLRLVDGDAVEESNLVRQIFYNQKDAAEKRLKVDALQERLNKFSNHTCIQIIPEYLRDKQQCAAVLEGSDFVAVTADYPRILLHRIVNMVCVAKRIPLIYSFVGQVGPLYLAGKSACFNCLEMSWREELGERHDQVVDALQTVPRRNHPSIVSGSTQIADAMFMETIAILTGGFLPETLNKRIKFGAGYGVTEVSCPRRSECPVCSGLRRRP